MKTQRCLLHVLIPAMLTWMTVSAAGADGLTMVPMGSIWKYLDTGTNLGTAGTAPLFDDSSWRSGPAQLGYGDGDEATLVDYGGNPGDKFITTYFRHAFEVPTPSQFSKVALRVRRDDGVKVYLNGAEIFRNNLPSDPVTAATRALEPMETTNFLSGADVDPALLVAGRNVLAVEMHQTATSATKLAFDLELTGITAPRLSIRLSPPTSALMTWPYPSTGFRLMETPSLSQPTWTDVTNPLPVQVDDENHVSVTPLLDTRFYRLRRD